MEAKFTMPPPGLATGLRLHDLVSELTVVNTLKLAANRNIMVNEVETDITLHSELRRVKELLGKIISLLSLELKDSVVRISAKVYTSLVLIHFRESNIDHSSGLLDALMQVVPDAERLGGYLGISSQDNGNMTIVLTILNERKQFSMDSFERLATLVVAKRQLFGQQPL